MNTIIYVIASWLIDQVTKENNGIDHKTYLVGEDSIDAVVAWLPQDCECGAMVRVDALQQGKHHGLIGTDE